MYTIIDKVLVIVKNKVKQPRLIVLQYNTILWRMSGNTEVLIFLTISWPKPMLGATLSSNS